LRYRVVHDAVLYANRLVRQEAALGHALPRRAAQTANSFFLRRLCAPFAQPVVVQQSASLHVKKKVNFSTESNP
jgi:hypothetical protein